MVAKASQDNKKDEFFALVKSCAQKSDDQKALLLRSRKYNGRTVLIILRHPLTLVVMYPDSQDRLPGYEQCLKDKQIITGDMYPKEGEPDVVLCAEAVAFVHQAPGEQTYVETPDIEVGHDGVETAWKVYLAWRNDLRLKSHKCPVTLALYAFAMLQGWSDSQCGPGRCGCSCSSKANARPASRQTCGPVDEGKVTPLGDPCGGTCRDKANARHTPGGLQRPPRVSRG